MKTRRAMAMLTPVRVDRYFERMFRTGVQLGLAPAGGAARVTERVAGGVPAACDVAVLGGGMAGMATALRLQAAGLSTVVFEAHGHVGGCAGYFRHKGFSFDVGATTLVDFEPGGVGGELLDRLAEVFWAASRSGVRLPVRRPADAVRDVRAIGLRHLPLARYVGVTLGGLLRRFGLREDAALVGLLGMLVEDTVHSTVDRAPLINAALGVTIRGAGLTRHRGGMHGFWRQLVTHYRALGGTLRTGCRVHRVTGQPGEYRVHTARGSVDAGQVVSALPATTTARIAGGLLVARRLRPYLRRDEPHLAGALVVFLGVPEDEVAGQPLTHHQVLQEYHRPLGDGNNMFVSVSAAGDPLSAPSGHRAVMISTHTGLAPWQGLSEAEYRVCKHEVGERLTGYARRVFPRLGERAVVRQVGTPRTYERFAFRPWGAVGGVRQTLANTNQHAIPHDLGGRGFWLVGDSTWPGLGTVACVLGSRIVADGVRREAARSRIATPRRYA